MNKSRSEAILENMLGANNVLEPPKSRIERLLHQLLEKINELADGSIFHLLGEKALVTDLPASGNEVGDVWFVKEKLAGYIWFKREDYPDGYWEELGEIVDFAALGNIFFMVSQNTTFNQIREAIRLGKVPIIFDITREGYTVYYYGSASESVILSDSSAPGEHIDFFSLPTTGPGSTSRKTIYYGNTWETISNYDSAIFDVEYGVTTLSEIDGAYDSNKILMCKIQSDTYYGYKINQGANTKYLFFGRKSVTVQQISYFYIMDVGETYYTEVQSFGVQILANLVTSLSSSSTDTQYPSAKCVYNAIIGAIEEAY